MQLVKGDLTKQQVTAIVNPTNTRLYSTGGVSGHIAKKAGPSFEQECKAVVASLPDGQTSVPEGSSAVMPCNRGTAWQHIIHAVVPSYSGNLRLTSFTSSMWDVCLLKWVAPVTVSTYQCTVAALQVHMQPACNNIQKANG